MSGISEDEKVGGDAEAAAREGGHEAAEDFRSRETSPSARFGLAATWETGLILSLPSAAR